MDSTPMSRTGRVLKAPLKMRPEGNLCAKPSSSPRGASKSPSGRGRGRPPKNYSGNVQADGSANNKWVVYKKGLTFLISSLKRNTYNLAFFTYMSSKDKAATSIGDGDNMTDEKNKCIADIINTKKRIRETFAKLSAESAEHRQWTLCDNDDDMVDIEHILCSTCMQSDTEGNDILLCDRAGCNRAYHQQCLDPAIVLDSEDPNDDWFCWRCECLDSCLDMVNEFREVEGEEEFENELRVYEEIELSGGGGAGPGQGYSSLDDDESDDDSYNPDNADEEEDSADGEGDSGSTAESTSDSCGSDRSGSVDREELDLLLSDAAIGSSIGALVDTSRALRSSAGSGIKMVVATAARDGSDVGKQLAVVSRGEVTVGAITGYDERSDLWTAAFDNRAGERTLGEEELSRGFRVFAEYERTRRELERVPEAGVGSGDEAVDGRNIIEGGRRRIAVDYAQMALLMFGSLEDDEDTDSEKEHVPKRRATRSPAQGEGVPKRKRGRPKKTESAPATQTEAELSMGVQQGFSQSSFGFQSAV